MAEVIVIANQKGGVGKSTTASALSAGLFFKGYKTLMIDLDAQSNSSYSSGVISNEPTAYEVMMGEKTAKEAIKDTPHGSVMASSRALDSLVRGMVKYKEFHLKEALEPILADYDFIVIDTPPAVSLLTINALMAGTRVIIPAQADAYSLQGIGQLLETIDAVKTFGNKSLALMGILMTRHNNRTLLSQEIMGMVSATADSIGTFVYHTVIRECIAIKEAQARKQDIFTYAPKSNAALDYNDFVTEVIGRVVNG